MPRSLSVIPLAGIALLFAACGGETTMIDAGPGCVDADRGCADGAAADGAAADGAAADGAAADGAAADGAAADGAAADGAAADGSEDACAMGPCGIGLATCTTTADSYACTCMLGFVAPATGGTCTDVDECATSMPCGAMATACTNTVGAYVCACAPGYAASTIGGTCTDIDECATSTPCGADGTGCTNTAGSYTCTCSSGYASVASGGTCTDIDECATGTPCGAEGRGCTNTAGSYTCTCSSGYASAASGGTCTDVDECAAGTHGCDTDPTACLNSPGSFSCACPTGFTGTGVGGMGCLLADPSLASLVPSLGSLSPAFAAGTTTYTLALRGGTASVTLTPTVTYPTHATITVDGVAVASGSASAAIPLAGFAPRALTVAVTTETGATQAYTVVLVRSSTYVKASNTEYGDEFGSAVALSSDGSTLAVAAIYEDSYATDIDGDEANDGEPQSGAVYVFTRTGTTWSQQAYVKASNTDAGDWFGWAVALSSDGSTLAVGAPNEDSSATGIDGDDLDNSASNAGAVYVFGRAGSRWSQQAYVKASNTGPSDGFGRAVAVSAEGSTLAVGAFGERSNATGIDGDQADNSDAGAGAVYVFTRSTGMDWSQEAYVKASNTQVADEFGSAVALSPDGSTLAVGADWEDSNATGIDGNQGDNSAPSAGAVYVFTRAGATWSQQAYIKASNTDAGDFFGSGVALSSDGSTLAVAAYSEASRATGIDGDQLDNSAFSAGAVYVFARMGTTWSQEAYVKASNTGAGGEFGRAIALSSDGSRLAVGGGDNSRATGIDGDQLDSRAPNSGVVYVFARVGTTWSQEAYIKASNTGMDDQFGFSVALSSEVPTLAIGAIAEASDATGIDGDEADSSLLYAGAVYVY